MSARWYLRGPSFGPLHTTLASGRIGGTRRRVRRVSRGPWWPRRFRTLTYWLLGVYLFELGFWALYGAVWTVLTITALWKARKP